MEKHSDAATPKKMTRKERVYKKLVELTQTITLKQINSTPVSHVGFEASRVGAPLDITPNNTCLELNALVKEWKAVKILGRPVYFLAKNELEQIIGVKILKNVFENVADFQKTVNIKAASVILKQPPPFPHNSTPAEPQDRSLSSLVGARESLAPNIAQAKAAVLYPPNGLHCLIIGETGVGKSYFAEAMYQYALEKGVIAPDAAFVIYNCANYSETPQLLLSQLFGYKKGAFTGADKDTPGIVDSANGGVLFLDEAHRLSSEGQEKMFLLIDKGIYQRLGETKTHCHATLRIIAATTENPKDIMLHTFLRRIPVLIKVPSLVQRGISERIRFILMFFWGEAGNMGCPLMVSREVIKSLVMYKCEGNIGQLRSDIQLLCANAYMQRVIGGASDTSEPLKLTLSYLPERVQEGLFETGGPSSNNLFKSLKFYANPFVTIDRSVQTKDELLQECGL